MGKRSEWVAFKKICAALAKGAEKKNLNRDFFLCWNRCIAFFRLFWNLEIFKIRGTRPWIWQIRGNKKGRRRKVWKTKISNWDGSLCLGNHFVHVRMWKDRTAKNSMEIKPHRAYMFTHHCTLLGSKRVFFNLATRSIAITPFSYSLLFPPRHEILKLIPCPKVACNFKPYATIYFS